ncbi:zinc ribbon domain-containing protein [Paenibacillus sp. IHBB 3054]|uniref:zinc ribbon domain-containing protein n=1 Tax=Paenibacillus sp. IHBB 3054 TaxID=3425689 RepID=UPI003F67A6B9
MTNAIQDTDLLQAARCEDLIYDQIEDLTVLGEFERKTVDTLKQSGAHLLMGARGVGKSMLLKQAEIELDNDFHNSRKIAVYVTFKTSTLLEGVKAEERDAFQVWVGAKILQALHDKLTLLNLIGHEGSTDPYYRIFGIESALGTKTMLQEKIHQLQKLSVAVDKEKVISAIGDNFLDRVNDVSFINEIIRDVIGEFNIEKLIFLFDEAAHTFIPSQQEIFFEIFKLLHGGPIAVKAAVYPSVTSYGRNFEVGHDAIVLPMDRYETGEIGRRNNRKLFRELLDKRLPHQSQLRKKIYQKGEILDNCIDLSTGNPRAFLHLLVRTLDKGFTDRALLLSTQEFVDQELLPYHNSLTVRLPKYSNHIKIGIDLLRSYIIQEIREKNLRERKNKYQSAFFTFPRDISPNLKLALDILCYSGVLTNKGTIKIADRKTGQRYMVHLALLTTEKVFTSSNINESLGSISLTDYREFNSNDSIIDNYLLQLKELSEKCSGCNRDLPPNAKFCSECGKKVEPTSIISSLLEEPVFKLPIANFLCTLVRPYYPRVGDIIQASREELMTIKWIKDVRSRIIKNAADEFVSG